MAARMHAEDLRELAHLIAVELIQAQAVPSAPDLVDAAEIARRFGVSRDWAYEHSAMLGAVRLGDGPRARLRFDLTKVAEILGAGDGLAPAAKPATAPGRRRRRAKSTTTTGAPLLPIRGEEP
jgi:hypothetical protein